VMPAKLVVWVVGTARLGEALGASLRTGKQEGYGGIARVAESPVHDGTSRLYLTLGLVAEMLELEAHAWVSEMLMSETLMLETLMLETSVVLVLQQRCDAQAQQPQSPASFACLTHPWGLYKGETKQRVRQMPHKSNPSILLCSAAMTVPILLEAQQHSRGLLVALADINIGKHGVRRSVPNDRRTTRFLQRCLCRVVLRQGFEPLTRRHMERRHWHSVGLRVATPMQGNKTTESAVCKVTHYELQDEPRAVRTTVPEDTFGVAYNDETALEEGAR